jgi:benzoyl-CoA reductase subunit C
MTTHPGNEVMNRFKDALESPYDKLRLWKEDRNTKIVGCSPMHFPEEIVHAAGMLPIVLQETEEAVTEGFSHVHSFFCGITRNLIDIGVKGQLNFFDTLIYSDICIQNRNAACTLKHILPANRVVSTGRGFWRIP